MAATTEDKAEEAINRVLAAEQRAREDIARCEAQAREIVEAARAQARRIEERNDVRVIKLRAACQQWIAARTGELQRTAEEVRARPAGEDERHGRLAAAAERLAALLTGSET